MPRRLALAGRHDFFVLCASNFSHFAARYDYANALQPPHACDDDAIYRGRQFSMSFCDFSRCHAGSRYFNSHGFLCWLLILLPRYRAFSICAHRSTGDDWALASPRCQLDASRHSRASFSGASRSQYVSRARLTFLESFNATASFDSFDYLRYLLRIKPLIPLDVQWLRHRPVDF